MYQYLTISCLSQINHYHKIDCLDLVQDRLDRRLGTRSFKLSTKVQHRLGWIHGYKVEDRLDLVQNSLGLGINSFFDVCITNYNHKG